MRVLKCTLRRNGAIPDRYRSQYQIALRSVLTASPTVRDEEGTHISPVAWSSDRAHTRAGAASRSERALLPRTGTNRVLPDSRTQDSVL